MQVTAAAFIALVIFRARWTIRARFPGLRAVEALATSLPLFLLLFRHLRRIPR
jgi:voltage-gated potassium channel